MDSVLKVATFLSPSYEPLYRFIAARLAATLGQTYRFEVGEDIAQFKIAEYDLAFACGWWYLQHSEKYQPLGAPVMQNPRYGGLPVYYVELVTSARSSIVTFDDLYGKVFGFNEEYSFSGFQALLTELDRRNHCLDIFSEVVRTGSHLNSLRALLEDEIDFATLDSTVLDLEFNTKPHLKKQLAVTTSFGPYPMPPLLVNKNLKGEAREKILETLLDLPSTELNRFGIKEFCEVNEQFYSVLARLTPEWSGVS